MPRLIYGLILGCCWCKKKPALIFPVASPFNIYGIEEVLSLACFMPIGNGWHCFFGSLESTTRLLYRSFPSFLSYHEKGLHPRPPLSRQGPHAGLFFTGNMFVRLWIRGIFDIFLAWLRVWKVCGFIWGIELVVSHWIIDKIFTHH